MHYRLDFTEEALDVHGEGRRILSLAFPVSTRPIVDSVNDLPVTNFLNGLLPEGNLRQRLAADLGVSTTDLMTILTEVGGDCAGAVQFLPADTAPPTPSLRALTRDEVDRMISDLPTYSLPEGAHLQASLAGIQDKVLLTDLGNGLWALPEGGAASSHIVKPEPLSGPIDRLIEAEHWSLELAAAAGLSAARSRVTQFDGRAAIVVSRFDRDESGARLHQEDFCQSLGLSPADKYESRAQALSGSRLSRIVRLASAQAPDPTELRVRLLRQVTFNTVLGNGDAHSKNYSLLIGERGEITTAPVYDVAPLYFMDRRFRGAGHVISGKDRLPDITDHDLAAEAVSWGLARPLAHRIVAETIDALRAASATAPTPDHLVATRKRIVGTLEQR